MLIDELHNLDIRTRAGAEASDQIKYLSERIPATFVLAGVDVKDTGLFTGRRGGQIASRYTQIVTSAFPHKTTRDKEAWQSLVVTLEDALRLHGHRPGTLAEAELLSARSRGGHDREPVAPRPRGGLGRHSGGHRENHPRRAGSRRPGRRSQAAGTATRETAPLDCSEEVSVTTGLRILPVALPPVHGETIGSYLNRLADANRLSVRQLSALIGPDRHHRRDDNRTGHWTPGSLRRLAALTGRDPAALSHAMPALATIREPGQRQPPLLIEEATEAPKRLACRPCMDRRGIPGLVIRSTPHPQGVCHRHRRWLLGQEQHQLYSLPEVHEANRRHRRLVHRRQDQFLALDYLAARSRMLSRFQAAGQSDLQQRWADRIRALGEDSYGDPYHPSEARIEIATYPEAVIITGLSTSPHWREHTDLRAEVARRLAIEAHDLPSDLLTGRQQ
ncbi:TniQ family protein [Streptomyces sp. NPDC029006]|uniref:TniQ family protein n=1 Tax=Streptomyces sp. NPDC029006 TaxID=3155467 RepID=UPI003400182C